MDMGFAVSMIWREQKDHITDCYFCLTNTKGYNQRNKKKILYPNLLSAIRPVLHFADLLVPIPPSRLPELKSESSENSENLSCDSDDTFPLSQEATKLNLITQEDLNDLVRDLNLTKSNSELLVSRLQQWILLAPETNVTFYHQRSQDLVSHFSTNGKLCYCNDVSALFQSIGMIHDQTNWRLNIDSSKESIKAALLHNGNRYPFVPVACSNALKETYYNLQLILDKLNYYSHSWYVCADLKVVALLRGLQLGYTNYWCFLCLWDSRAHNRHYM